ncbi:hypothetical protein ACVWWO_003644 [Bradyrhizobium sp. F1.13.1]
MTASIGLVLAAASLLCVVDPSPGVAAEQWWVKHRLLGKDGKQSKDVSGIGCSATQGFPRECRVIDDNLQEAQFVMVKDGKIVAGDAARHIHDTSKKKPLELDGEGVAYADGYFYVIGSHGHPRDKDRKLDPRVDAAKIKERIAASNQIVRFRGANSRGASTVERTDKLREAIALLHSLERAPPTKCILKSVVDLLPS